MPRTSAQTPSFQQLRRERVSSAFVGRSDELELYEQNLALGLRDPRRRFIVAVDGQGGMGKTWLLRRFRDIAMEAGALCAWSDDAQSDAVEVMTAWVSDLDPDGSAFTAFRKRQQEYQARRRELESDPSVSSEVAELIARAVGKGAVVLGRRVPLAGAAFDFVDEGQAGEVLGNVAGELARRIGNKQDLELLARPLEALTPLFLDGLQGLDSRPFALFLDTYEATAHYVEAWLRRLLDGDFGALPGDLVLSVAGRDPLDPNVWSEYGDVTARVDLSPFSDDEARTYLREHGIQSTSAADALIELSGRMPLLLATLATQPPDDEAELRGAAGTAVERFLKWVTDPERRDLALEAAIPRSFNRDVLTALVGDEQRARRDFEWLVRLPFVSERSGHWVYHQTVRSQMLRHLRRESPARWSELHEQLRRYYADRQTEAFSSDGVEVGRRMGAEVSYHSVCGACHATAKDLTYWAAVAGLRQQAHRVAVAIAQAERDAETAGQLWGPRLVAALDTENANEELTALLDEMLGLFADETDGPRRASILLTRFGLNEQSGAGTVDDLLAAQRAHFHPPLEVLVATELHRRGRSEEAIRHLEAVLEDDGLDDGSLRALAFRMLVGFRLAAGDAHGALRAAEAGLAAQPDDVDLRLDKAQALFAVQRPKDALEELAAVREESPENAHVTYHLAGNGLRQAGSFAAAERAFRQAILTSPECLMCWDGLGEVLTQGKTRPVQMIISSFGNAISDEQVRTIGMAAAYEGAGLASPAITLYRRASESRPDDANAIAHLGALEAQRGEHQEGLRNLERAIELAPEWPWPRVRRAVLLRSENLGTLDQVLEDLDRALDEPDCPTVAHWWRAETLYHLGRPEEALQDINEYLSGADDDDGDGYAVRAVILKALDDYAGALTDIRRVLELLGDERSECHRDLRNELGLLLACEGKFDEARAVFQALTQTPAIRYNLAVTATLADAPDAPELREKAIMALDKAEEAHVRLYGVAGLAAVTGEAQEAIEGLRDARALSSDVEAWARYDMAWRHLREEPAFLDVFSEPASSGTSELG